MSIDKRVGSKIPKFADKDAIIGAKLDPGPYVGTVKNVIDPTRSGRLQVWIPEFGGFEDEQAHWITVSYASPFMGAARQPRVSSEKQSGNSYDQVNHTYGMWFTPPDIGNNVLVTFIGGDTNRGYWFACVMPELSHHAIPGLAGAEYLEKPTDDLAGALTTPPYPAVEFNDENDQLQTQWNNFLKIQKPVHKDQVKTLLNQGLEDDKVRGVITSSSQRESPSHVFGVSTPGKGSDKKDNKTGSPHYRLGGHTFVMDDGDASGKSSLVRIRTAGGHQILMRDPDSGTGDNNTLYIANAAGTVWMEFTASGTLNVYSHNQVNIRANSDINMHSGKNINLFAAKKINMLSGEEINVETEKYNLSGHTGIYEHGGVIELLSSTQLSLQASTGGSFAAGTQLVCTAGIIHLNPAQAPAKLMPPKAIPLTKFTDTNVAQSGSGWKKWKPSAKVSSIVSCLPTHEPFDRSTLPAADQYRPQSTAASFSPTPTPYNGGTVTTGSGGNLVDSSGTPVTYGDTVTEQGVATAKGQGVSGQATPADLAAQKANSEARKPIGPLSTDEVTALKVQMGKSESSFNYADENSGGYIGKYQFGAAALADQEYVKPGTTNKGLSDPSNWTGKDGISSREVFKTATEMQEKIMEVNLQRNYSALRSNGTITSSSTNDDISGKLAVSHLLGAGGCKKWANGGGGQDANGTKGETYYNRGRYANTVLAPLVPAA